MNWDKPNSLPKGSAC